MRYEWDPAKAEANRKKHGIRFADAVAGFGDPGALTLDDPHPGEERYVTLGMDAFGRLLVVVYTWREDRIRLISAPEGEQVGAEPLRAGGGMKQEYDFGNARRGALDPLPSGKTRITIRLDDDVLEWFRGQAEDAGGGNYQTLINAALRQHIAHESEPLEETLRRVVREELRRSA